MPIVGQILIGFGVLIILTRAPLIVAPEATRDLYLKLLSDDSRMRIFGGVFAVLGAIIAFTVRTETGLEAQVLFYCALVVALMTGLLMVPFPGMMRGWALRIWNKFSANTMRALGTLAVLFGGWLVWLGLGM